jgi:hypothetical protein
MRRDDEILQLSRARCTRRTMLRGVAGAAAVGAVWPLAREKKEPLLLLPCCVIPALPRKRFLTPFLH